MLLWVYYYLVLRPYGCNLFSCLFFKLFIFLFDLKCEAHHICAQLVTVPKTGVRQQT